MQQKDKRTDVNELGEFGLIRHLTDRFSLRQPSSKKGIGDDAAVLDHTDLQTVISTDMLVEGIHFDLMYMPLQHLGYKSVVVNLSDIYAMNATPTQITVSVALSNRFSVEAMESFYDGVYRACERYGVDLIGGDTTSSPRGLTISVTAIGQAPEDQVVYRNTARVGDIICVSGDLGGAYLGLQLLEREKQLFLDNPDTKPDLEGQDYLVGRQLKPEARKDVIKLFHKNDLVPTSMIDISDGLASELFHICTQSKVGAFIEEKGVPIHDDTQMMALKFKLDPITCALSGGEDYELLFTVRPEDIDKVKFLPELYIIGDIVPRADGIKLHTVGGNVHPIKAQGWKHFGQ